MQYQVFVQNLSEQKFLASVVGISNLTAEGTTEEEAVSNVKYILESQLSSGKFINIDVNVELHPPQTTSQMRYAGIFADDPTFDDFMEKLALIRQESNAITD